jgi:hypothetical protein
MSTNLLAIVRDTPPVAVGGLVLCGIPIVWWLQVASLTYTVILLLCKLPALIEALVALRQRWKEWNGKGK